MKADESESNAEIITDSTASGEDIFIPAIESDIFAVPEKSLPEEDFISHITKTSESKIEEIPEENIAVPAKIEIIETYNAEEITLSKITISEQNIFLHESIQEMVPTTIDNEQEKENIAALLVHQGLLGAEMSGSRNYDTASEVSSSSVSTFADLSNIEIDLKGKSNKIKVSNVSADVDIFEDAVEDFVSQMTINTVQEENSDPELVKTSIDSEVFVHAIGDELQHSLESMEQDILTKSIPLSSECANDDSMLPAKTENTEIPQKDCKHEVPVIDISFRSNEESLKEDADNIKSINLDFVPSVTFELQQEVNVECPYEDLKTINVAGDNEGNLILASATGDLQADISELVHETIPKPTKEDVEMKVCSNIELISDGLETSSVVTPVKSEDDKIDYISQDEFKCIESEAVIISEGAERFSQKIIQEGTYLCTEKFISKSDVANLEINKNFTAELGEEISSIVEGVQSEMKLEECKGEITQASFANAFERKVEEKTSIERIPKGPLLICDQQTLILCNQDVADSIIEHNFDKQEVLAVEESSDENFIYQVDSEADFSIEIHMQDTVKEDEISELPKNDAIAASSQPIIQEVSETIKTDILWKETQDEVTCELQNSLSKQASVSESQVLVAETTKTMPLTAVDPAVDFTLSMQKINVIESPGLSSLEAIELGTSDSCKIIPEIINVNENVLPKFNTEETELHYKNIEELYEGFMEHKDQIPTHFIPSVSMNDFKCSPILEGIDTLQNNVSESDAAKSVTSDLCNIPVYEFKIIATEIEDSAQALTVKETETMQHSKESFTEHMEPAKSDQPEKDVDFKHSLAFTNEDILQGDKSKSGTSLNEIHQIEDESLNVTGNVQESNMKRAELFECHEYAESVEPDLIVDFKFSDVLESADAVPPCFVYPSEEFKSDPSKVDKTIVREIEFKDSEELKKRTESDSVEIDGYLKECTPMHERLQESLVVDFKFSSVLENTNTIQSSVVPSPEKYALATSNLTQVMDRMAPEINLLEFSINRAEPNSIDIVGQNDENFIKCREPSIVDFKFLHDVDTDIFQPGVDAALEVSGFSDLNKTSIEAFENGEMKSKEHLEKITKTESTVETEKYSDECIPEDGREAVQLNPIVNFKDLVENPIPFKGINNTGLISVECTSEHNKGAESIQLNSVVDFKDLVENSMEFKATEQPLIINNIGLNTNEENCFDDRIEPPKLDETDSVVDIKCSSLQKSKSHDYAISIPETLRSEGFNLPKIHSEEMQITLSEIDDSDQEGNVTIDTDESVLNKGLIDVYSGSMKISIVGTVDEDGASPKCQNAEAFVGKVKDTFSTDEESNDLSQGMFFDSHYNADSVSGTEDQTSSFCTLSDDFDNSVDDFTDVPSHLTLTEDSDRWSDVEADLSTDDMEFTKDKYAYNLKQNNVNKSSKQGEINLSYDLQSEFQVKDNENVEDEYQGSKTELNKPVSYVGLEQSATEYSLLESTTNFPLENFQQNMVSAEIIESKTTTETQLGSVTFPSEVSSLDNFNTSIKLIKEISDTLQTVDSENSVMTESGEHVSIFQEDIHKECEMKADYSQDISPSSCVEEKGYGNEFADTDLQEFQKDLEICDDVSTEKPSVDKTVSNISVVESNRIVSSDSLLKQDTEKNQMSIEASGTVKTDPTLLMIIADTANLHETDTSSELTDHIEETVTSGILTARSDESLKSNNMQENFPFVHSKSDLCNTELKSEQKIPETSVSATITSSDDFTDMPSQHILTEESEQWSDIESDAYVDALEKDIIKDNSEVKLHSEEIQSKLHFSDENIKPVDHTDQSDVVVSEQTYEIPQPNEIASSSQTLQAIPCEETAKMNPFDEQGFDGIAQTEHYEEAVSDSLRSEQILVRTSAQDLSFSAMLIDTSVDGKLLEHFADIKSLNDQLSVAEPFIPLDTEIIVPQKQDVIDVSSAYLEKTDNSDYWLEADTDYSISEFGEESVSVSDKQNYNQFVAETTVDDVHAIAAAGIDASLNVLVPMTDTSISSFYTDPENSDQISDTCADISLQGATTENSDRLSDIEVDDVLYGHNQSTEIQHEILSDMDPSQLKTTLCHTLEESKVTLSVHEEIVKTSEPTLKLAENISPKSNVSDISDLISTNLTLSSSDNGGKSSDVQQILELTANTSSIGISDNELTNVTPLDVPIEDSDRFSDISDSTSLGEIEDSEIVSLKCDNYEDASGEGVSHSSRETLSHNISPLLNKNDNSSDIGGIEKDFDDDDQILSDKREFSGDAKHIADEHTSSESAQGERTETSHDEFTDVSSVSLKGETSNEEYTDVHSHIITDETSYLMDDLVDDKSEHLSYDLHETSESHDAFSDVLTHISTNEVSDSVSFLKSDEQKEMFNENEVSELYNEFPETPLQISTHVLLDSAVCDFENSHRENEVEFRNATEVLECTIPQYSQTDDVSFHDLSNRIGLKTESVNEERYVPDEEEFDENIEINEVDHQDEMYILENEPFEINEDELIYPLQYNDWIEQSFDLKEYGIEAAFSECESDVHGFGIHEEYDDEDIQRAIDLNISNFEEEEPIEEVPFSADSFKTLSTDISPHLKVSDKEQDSWSTADAPSIVEEEDLSEHDNLLSKIDKLLAEDFTFDEYHKSYEDVDNSDFFKERHKVDIEEKQDFLFESKILETDSTVCPQSQSMLHKICLKDSLLQDTPSQDASSMHFESTDRKEDFNEIIVEKSVRIQLASELEGSTLGKETSFGFVELQNLRCKVDQAESITENINASETTDAAQTKNSFPNDVLSTFQKSVQSNVEQCPSISESDAILELSKTSGETKLSSEQQSVPVETNVLGKTGTAAEENINHTGKKVMLSSAKQNISADLLSGQPVAVHKEVEIKTDIPIEKIDSFANKPQQSLNKEVTDFPNSSLKENAKEQEEEIQCDIPSRTEASIECTEGSDKLLDVSELKAVVSKNICEEKISSSDYKPDIPTKTKHKPKSLKITKEVLQDQEQSDERPALPPKKSKRSSSLHSSSSEEFLSSSSESLSSFESAASKRSDKMDVAEGKMIIADVAPDVPVRKSKSFSSSKKSEDSDDSSSSSSFSYRGRKKSEQAEWGDLTKKRPSIDERMIKLQNEGKCANKEKAFIAAKLIEMQFEEEDALMASRQCSSVYHAVKFLTQLCELCNCRFPINLMSSMFHCTHRACKECLKAHFTSLIYDRSIFTLLCPVCCKPDITDQNIQEYFNHLDMMLRNILDSKVYDLFQRKLRDEVLTKDPNFHWCSQCSSGFIASPRLKKLYCPDCLAITCALCHQTWELEHEGVHCERFQQWKDMHTPEPPPAGLVKLLTDRGITCPSCGLVYAQACGGCLMYKCSHCSFEFCGFCQQPIKRGKECADKICESRGIHAHHPNNCLFYVRDADMSDIQILLQEESVEYLTIPPKDQIVKSRCQVREQKHIHGAISEDRCGRDIEPYCAGLCRTHYFEYLTELLRNHKISPLPIMTVQDLQFMLRKSRIPVPEKVKGESTNDYYDRLTKVVTCTLT